jgi:serine/threonine-protein kinase
VAPVELLHLLAEVKGLVANVSKLRSESVAEQRKLETLEARGREGRQRFGFAVDALGIDASKARDEARVARGEMAPFTAATAEAKQRLLGAHREILLWEGRSAFVEPFAALREAYEGAALAVGSWLEARTREQTAGALAEKCDREVADLEFQIQELRGALAKLEQDVEDEKNRSQQRIAELDRQSEALQVELLALASRFCAPLRRKPELMPLFHELEAEAAA